MFLTIVLGCGAVPDLSSDPAASFEQKSVNFCLQDVTLRGNVSREDQREFAESIEARMSTYHHLVRENVST